MEPIAESQAPGAELDTRELLDMGCGRQIGRYTLLRRIAAGGMAEVYVAFSKGLMAGFEKRVAIKKILPQHSHNERFIDMLVDEAKITVSLTHPNIAQVYELGLHHEDYFIAMEYVNGRPLNRLMQRVDERGLNVIPVEFAAHIMAEVAKGLDHAHKQKDQRGRPLGIVHRDVSPQNILISYQGDVKLIDFGIARAEGRVNQTSQGVIKGKLRYLAPEIAAGEEPDHRADVFCCGIVLFEMLTGEAMFAPKTDLEAIELATEARVKSPRSRNQNVPQDLDDIVMKALARYRDERYQSAKELYGDLRRFLNQHFPTFVGSELGDFMQQMFEVEISQERQLDELAENVARRPTDGFGEAEEDPTISATPGALIGPEPHGSYKQLVTRLGIGGTAEDRVRITGADGGRDMSVVPADDPSYRPLIRDPGERKETEDPRTLPPEQLRFPAGAEPTVKADNPFVVDAPSGNPTVMGPPPLEGGQAAPDEEPKDAADTDKSNGRITDKQPKPGNPPNRTTSLDLWEGRSSEVIIPSDPTRKNNYLPSAEVRIRRGPNVAYVIAFVATVVAMGGAAWMIAPGDEPDPVVIDAEARDTIELQPISIDSNGVVEEKPQPASLSLTVSPEGVPVTVHVDGRTKASREVPPLNLSAFAPNEIHRIVVSADGYKTREMSRRLGPGSNELDVRLHPALGKIRLRGVPRGATIRTSHGQVKRNRIVGIPLDSKVRVVVDRPGARAFSTSVEVKSLEEVNVAVPPLRRLPKGTLVVNARPMSQVYIGKRFVGRTPKRIRLTAGSHRITLKSPDGKTKTFSRRVNPGKTTTLTFRWR